MDTVAELTNREPCPNVRRSIKIILAVWLLYLVWLAVLQMSGAGVGFKIWPLGEDRNWIYLLRSGNPSQIFNEFWDLDHRNPMAAFWWILASPIIKASDWGLHAVSLIVSPIAAIVTFLLMDKLSRGRSVLFCLLTSIVVLLWNFPARQDHVDRVMVIALIFSMLTMYAYARFIDGNREKVIWLLAGVVFYLVALATYTIQSGAIIAVPFIAFFRLNRPLKDRIIISIADSAFFFLVFAVYTYTWISFSGPTSGNGFHIGLADLIANMGASLKGFLMPPSNGMFFNMAWVEFLPLERRLWWLFSGVCAFFLIMLVAGRSNAIASKPPIGWVALLLVAMGLPTVLVEAGNPLWGPASRSIMVLQVWEPMLIVAIIFGACSLIREGIVRTWFAVLGVVGVCTVMLYVTIGFNHFQTDVSMYQRNLAIGLREIDSKQSTPMSYLVHIKDRVSGKVGTEPNLAAYAPTILGRNETSLRLFVAYPSPAPAFDETWKVKFSDDGVRNAKAYFDKTVVPYENLKIVHFDGLKVVVPETVSADDLQGLQIEWNKSTPITQ